jgi:hypothetical protein
MGIRRYQKVMKKSHIIHGLTNVSKSMETGSECLQMCQVSIASEPVPAGMETSGCGALPE